MSNSLSTYFRYAKWEIDPDAYFKSKISNKPPYTYICFTNNPKLGVTHATESKIPAGIFGYPLNYNVQEDIEDGEIQEASEKKYAHFFNVKGKSIIYTSKGDSSLNYARLIRTLLISSDFDKEWQVVLKSKYKNKEARLSFIHKCEQKASVKSDIGKLLSVTRYLSKEKPKLWSDILQRLEIKGIVDDKGIGLFDSNEASRALFLSIKNVKVDVSNSNVFSSDLIYKRSVKGLSKPGSTLNNLQINTLETGTDNIDNVNLKNCRIYVNSKVTFSRASFEACTVYGLFTNNPHNFVQCTFVKCRIDLYKVSIATFTNCKFIDCVFPTEAIKQPTEGKIRTIFANCYMNRGSKANFKLSNLGSVADFQWKDYYINNAVVPPTIAPITTSIKSEKEMAEEIKEAARSVGGDGRFGRKVFIKAAWDAIKERSLFWQSKGRKAFDDFLVRANREGLINLVRADLVQAMDPKLVKESEIIVKHPGPPSMFSDFGSITFHLIEV